MNTDELKQRVMRVVADVAKRIGMKQTANEAAIKAWENERREELEMMMPAVRAADHFERQSERNNLEWGSELWERQGIAKAEREFAAHKEAADRGDSLSFGWGRFGETRERHAAAKPARDRDLDDDLELGL